MKEEFKVSAFPFPCSFCKKYVEVGDKYIEIDREEDGWVRMHYPSCQKIELEFTPEDLAWMKEMGVSPK